MAMKNCGRIPLLLLLVCVVCVGSVGQAAFDPIRIGVFHEDFLSETGYCKVVGELRPDYKGGTPACIAEAVWSSAAVQTMFTEVVPAAVELHEARLSVQRESIPAVNMADGVSSSCSHFSVPSNQSSGATTTSDLLIYVGSASDGWYSWVDLCFRASDNRPNVAVMSLTPDLASATYHNIRSVAHQIGHALGFVEESFTSVNLVLVTTARGLSAKLVNGSNVRSWARDYYNCPTVEGAQLEELVMRNETAVWITEQYNSWKSLIAYDDLMSFQSVAMKYSNLTLSAFVDLGYYEVNWSAAEEMAWGYHAGCDLFEKKCIVGGVATTPSLFCATETAPHVPCHSTASCTADYMAIATCKTTTYSADLLSIYSYFSDPKVGGAFLFMDVCPIRAGADTFYCSSSSASDLKGSVFGESTRCLPSPTSLGITVPDEDSCQVSAICADVRCASDGASYEVRAAGGAWTACAEGVNTAISTTGGNTVTVRCPPAEVLCDYTEPTPSSVQSSGKAATTSNSESAGVRGAGFAAVLLAASALLVLA